MTKGKLSARQNEIYKYICSYSQSHGFPPSVREIGKAVGLASPSTVHMHLKVLEDKELVYRTPQGYVVYDKFMDLWLKRI